MATGAEERPRQTGPPSAVVIVATTSMALMLTWLGVNAIWGLSSASHTLVSAGLARVGRLDAALAVIFGALAVAASVTHRRRKPLSEPMGPGRCLYYGL